MVALNLSFAAEKKKLTQIIGMVIHYSHISLNEVKMTTIKSEKMKEKCHELIIMSIIVKLC